MLTSVGVIVTAGGIGKRMNAKVPKQFLEIEGIPVFIMTLKRIFHLLKPNQTILTMPEGFVADAEKILVIYGMIERVEVIAGGSERFHSVKNALEKINQEVVLIHDAVRPFLSKELCNNLLEKMRTNDAAIPVLKVNETLRKIENETSRTVDRSQYRIVQTPQAFNTAVIKKAYQQNYNDGFTDDASVLESMGIDVHLVEGNRENIKITVPEDLKWGSFYAQNINIFE